MNGEFIQNFLVASSKLSVALALTVKSSKGIFAAKSCEGCAALWIIASGANCSKILKISSLFLISISKCL